MSKLFTIDKRSGQLFINDTNSLDVNRLHSDKVFFSVEVLIRNLNILLILKIRLFIDEFLRLYIYNTGIPVRGVFKK